MEAQSTKQACGHLAHHMPQSEKEAQDHINEIGAGLRCLNDNVVAMLDRALDVLVLTKPSNP